MVKLKKIDLKEFLNEKYEQYNRPTFIGFDPVSIPHQFSEQHDIEIAAFLSATIAWGQRTTIINNANKLMQLMDGAPYEFLMNARDKNFVRFAEFKHRTFNGVDAVFFMKSLQHIYKKKGGLQAAFKLTKEQVVNNEFTDLLDSISHFRELFFSIPYPARTGKHVSNPADNSSAKRLCMFLRWLVRDDKRGVDFGIWALDKKIMVETSTLKPLSAYLMCPLDVHSGNVARKLGLLKRTQNDWKAVEELTAMLRTFDANDPVKYDFALFGLGAFEKF